MARPATPKLLAALALALGLSSASPGQAPQAVGDVCADVRGSYESFEPRIAALKTDLAALVARHASEKELDAKRGALADLIYRQDCVRPEIQADPVRGPSVQRRWVTLTTYYFTNRSQGPSEGGVVSYGADRNAGSPGVGRISVSIPTARQPGELNLPLNLWLFELPADPAKHFIIRSVTPLAGNAALTEIRNRLAQTSRKSVLLFVHGYNVSFNDAALRTAQLSHDLNFPGLPMFFSWPSAARTAAYPHDEEMAQLSLDAFDKVLDEIGGLGASEIYIVAHSMGNRVVTATLARRVANHKQIPANLKGLLLAAPDINADIFREQIAPGLAALAGTSRTIYASNNDVALRASSALHAFPRVGLTRPQVQVFKGFETIDATTAAPVRRGYGHSYVTDSPRVIRDMQALIFLKRGAQARGLTHNGKPPSAYWVLK
jgi:esterase/lipase superfamily enzyme